MHKNYFLNNYIRLSLPLFLLLIISGTTSAQQTTTQSLYWIRYHNQLYFSPTWQWNNEIDNRRFFNPDVENQLIMHSRVHYRKDRWDLAGGLTSSFAFAQFPERGYEHSTLELRPVLEASHEIPLKKWLLQNRIRLDNRFFEVNEDENIFEHSNYVLRIRYRCQIKVPLKRASDGSTKMNLRIFDEIMVNHKENFFDQNRVYTAIDFAAHKNLTLETQYIYIHQQRFGREEFFHRHVFRFTVLHRINLHKSAKS